MSIAPSNSYTRTAIALHWIIAQPVYFVFFLGLYMTRPAALSLKSWFFSSHKSIGICLLLLIVMRLYWRITHRPPPLPARIPRWKWLYIQGIFLLHYSLTLIVPLSGWLMSSAIGFKLVLFGILPLPDLVGKNLALMLPFLGKDRKPCPVEHQN